MADPKIYIRRSATPNKVPTDSQLSLGELAVNTRDGKLYLKKDETAVGLGSTVVAVNPWSVGVGTVSYDTYFTSGNVGIKTTSPISALDVRGTISIGRTDVSGINSIRSVVDINSWEYYGIFRSVAAEDTAPSDLYFSPDGTKMFVLGDTGNDVNEYTLSTPWEVGSASFVTVFSVAAQETNPTGLYFKPDGTRMYICGQTGVSPTGDRVYSYTLSTPWSLSSATYDTINFNVAQDTAPQGVYLKDDDGTKMYIVGSTNDAVYEYSLGTAWDVSTATLSTTFPIGVTNTQNLPLSLLTPVGIDFNSSGTKMFVIDQTRDIVSRFNLLTPWDISTAVFYDNVYIGFQELTPTGIFYEEEQSRAYIVGQSGDAVYQYNTDVPSLEFASSGISTRSSIILNNEARLNNRLYVTGDIHASSNTILNGTITVNSTASFPSTLSHTGTSGIINNTTSANTLSLATGVVGSNVSKVINVGTGGAANSRTLITLGSATAGAISTITVPSPSNLIIGSAIPTGTASQPLQVTGGAYVSGNLGIGTTNPTTRLDVLGDLNVSGVITASGINAPLFVDESEDDSAFYNIPFLDQLAGGDTYRLLQVDNGGLTFNPGTNILGVAGASAGNGTFTIFGGLTPQLGMNITASNDVGIGTTNPTSKLQVVGDVNISGVITASNLTEYKILDNISSSFNGSTTQFTISSSSVNFLNSEITSAARLLISVGGVVQAPDPTQSNGYYISGGTNLTTDPIKINFVEAPKAGQQFFGVAYGLAVSPIQSFVTQEQSIAYSIVFGV